MGVEIKKPQKHIIAGKTKDMQHYSRLYYHECKEKTKWIKLADVDVVLKMIDYKK